MTFVPGFSLQEAEPLLALLASLEGGLDVPPLPALTLPPGWTILFDSQSIGLFDNRWQLAKSPQGQLAVLIRGTVDQTGSILDDLLSVMLPANSRLSFSSLDLGYQLAAADNADAGVHLGFLLAMLILMYDLEKGILWQLIDTVPAGSDVFIAGHSQGAAIATLLRSYLNYLTLPGGIQMGTFYNYKSYVFAQPKPGNDLYGADYDSVAGDGGLAFTVNNSQDWVPQVPFTIELPGDVNTPNPLSVGLGSATVTAAALAQIEADAGRLQAGVAAAQVAKHTPKMAALATILQAPKFQQRVLGNPAPRAIAPGTPQLPPILSTLNFAGCGSTYGLLGTPGANPCQPSDFFWQHHAAMYYALLQGRQIPTQCG
jgi:hypothetical protein